MPTVTPPSAGPARTRVVGYIRVSTEHQADEGVSLEAQRARLEAFALATDLVLVGVEVDAGISAKTLERPGIQRALARLEAGEADGVLVAKLDRLTRSVRDLGELVERYFASRFSLLSVSDAIDTRSASGRLVLNVLCSVAQWEREATAERTREALAHLKRQGVRLGAPALGGSQGAEGAADEGELRTVARIGALRAEGLTLRAIATALTAEGHRTKRGGAWGAETVRKVLVRVHGVNAMRLLTMLRVDAIRLLMGRPALPPGLRAETTSLRLNPAYRAALTALVDEDNRRAEASGLAARASDTDIMRALILHAFHERGLQLPAAMPGAEAFASRSPPTTPTPAPPLASTLASSAPRSAPASRTVEHPETPPAALPAARPRTDQQLAQLVAVVAKALERLQARTDDELLSVAELVRGLDLQGLDRRDVADALGELRQAGVVELRKEDSPRLHPPDDQRLALPGPRNTIVLWLRVMVPRDTYAAPLSSPSAAPSGAPAARTGGRAPGSTAPKASGKGGKGPAAPTAKSAIPTGKARAAVNLDTATDDQLAAAVRAVCEVAPRGAQTRFADEAGWPKKGLNDWLHGKALPAARRAAVVKVLRAWQAKVGG